MLNMKVAPPELFSSRSTTRSSGDWRGRLLNGQCGLKLFASRG